MLMATFIIFEEMWTREAVPCRICALSNEAFLEGFLISFEQSYLTFFFFECILFTHEKQRFLEQKINPMTYETLGDLVEGSLGLAFAWKLDLGSLGVKQSFW